MSLDIKVFTLGPFSQQPLVLWDSTSLEAFIIDPGTIDKSIDNFINEYKLKIIAIINTHAHIDHIAGICYYKSKYNVPFYVHKKEEFTFSLAEASAKMYQLPMVEIPKIDKFIFDEEKLYLGDEEVKIIETPGHTPGGICLVSDKYLITGDTLFKGSIGRTDLPGGNFELLKVSLNKLVQLNEDLIVVAGHGELSTLAEEYKNNPFLNTKIY